MNKVKYEKTGNTTSAQYAKEFIYEVLSILVHGLWSNGFGQTDGPKEGRANRQSGDYMLDPSGI